MWTGRLGDSGERRGKRKKILTRKGKMSRSCPGADLNVESEEGSERLHTNC